MVARDIAASCGLWLLPIAFAAGCAAAPYSPCPVGLDTALPADAFVRCKEVLLREYGSLTDVDDERFLLRSGWLPTQDPPGERRAAIFLDGPDNRELTVVVELRWLSVPWFGTPGWTAARGDAEAERALAARLREALSTQS